MARPTTGKKQQSLSLGEENIEWLEEEAKRLGVKKSNLVDHFLNAQRKESELAEQAKPTVITIMNYKGGVAKTTTSSSLAVCFTEMGYKVLVIDMDGQGNISQLFRVYDPRSEEPCIADVLFHSTPGAERLPLEKIIKTAELEGSDKCIYIAPSNFRFADADARMKSEGSAGTESRLRFAIEDMDYRVDGEKIEFDYIIIDCGPKLDMTTTNAIVALEAGDKKSQVIIPVKIDGFAIAGVAQTVEMIYRTARECRTQPKPWKILRTLAEPRTNAYKIGLEELKKGIPNAQYFNTQISKGVVASESSIAMIPLVSYDPTGKQSLEYRVLAEEIEAEIGY